LYTVRFKFYYLCSFDWLFLLLCAGCSLEVSGFGSEANWAWWSGAGETWWR